MGLVFCTLLHIEFANLHIEFANLHIMKINIVKRSEHFECFCNKLLNFNQCKSNIENQSPIKCDYKFGGNKNER